MDPALYISMTGAKRSLAEQSVYSNNLANVNTPGFREDIYQAESLYFNGGELPSQTFTTSKESAINLKPGPMMSTGRHMDVAIQGKGWFVVQNDNGERGLSRVGDFMVNQAGLLTTGAGKLVMGGGGPISIPPHESLQIGEDGSITIVPQGEPPTSATVLDRIMLVKPEPKSLVKGSDGLVYSKGSSDFEPDASVRVVSRMLEGSNVNAVDQMVSMITASRDFETQLKLMKSVDENTGALARLLQL